MRKYIYRGGLFAFLILLLIMSWLFYTRFTQTGFFGTYGLTMHEIKLTLNTDYATYYLYEREKTKELGIISTIKTKTGYQKKNEFVGDAETGIVQGFGRAIRNGSIKTYDVWGGTVFKTEKSGPWQVTIKNRIITPQVTTMIDGKVYFLHTEENN